MIRTPARALFLVALLAATLISPAQAQTAATCGLDSPAFCDTFNVPAGTGNRSGQLNGTVWGVSHVTGDQNLGQPANGWPSVTLSICGSTQTIKPPNDIFICNGQLVEGQDDNQTVTAITMYPKQPFDFAGRTGKVTFDVSNNSAGSHSAWPEFWITDKPVPSPFTHESSLQSVPQNGLGIRFAGFSNGQCPEGSPAYVGVDSAITVSNYVGNDTFNGGNLALQGLDCVKASTSPTSLNHYEIDVAQNQIDVYGTDAGTVAPLKHLASIPNANLSFTRGLIWIEDAHYNGSKFGNQGTNTFTWDNVGFDGPVLPQDRTYDIPDNTTPDGTDPNTGAPVTNLGYFIQGGQTHTFTFTGVDADAGGGALLTYGFYYQANGPWNVNYSVNGHPHTLPWPYPYTQDVSPQTIAIPLNVTELFDGTNTISLTPAQSMNVFNVDLVAVGAGGIQGQPTATPVATGTPTSTPLPTATPAPTSTPAPANTPTPPPTATPPAGNSPFDCTVSIAQDGTLTGTCTSTN